MATVPVRGLADKGILRDPSPYQLDLNAWSGGSNIRCHANKLEAAPIWRTAYDALPEAPVFCSGYEPSTGYDKVTVVGADGRLWQYSGGTFSEVTEPGHVANPDPRAVVSTALGDVQYINRPDAAPRYFGPASTAFAPLPHMECAWTCRSLRAFGDVLFALNVTKPASYTDPHTGQTMAGGAIPNLVKWSDLTLDGQTPGAWDPTDPATNAGENPLEEARTPIVDGLAMRSTFVIYTADEIYGATAVNSNDVFNFSRLFSSGGLIAPNCMVEVDGVHYCFGPKDIYKHDGIQKMSIIDKRNKVTLFRNLNVQKSEVCFVAYIPHLDSLLFGYNTGDTSAAFRGADRCNQGALYDLTNDTWTFIDLPNISAVTMANMDTVLSWTAPATLTWANAGGSWYDQENSYVKSAVAVSSALPGSVTNSRLVCYDFCNKGWLAFPYEPECNTPAFVERTGIALDQLGSDLTTYKSVRALFPLVVMYDNVPVLIQIGWSMTPSGAVTWGAAIPFNPITDYKIDIMTGGRYLAIRFTVPQPADFELAGYDLDVSPGGRR